MNLIEINGLEFEAGYLFFFQEFADVPGVYIVYTDSGYLDIGSTQTLKTTLETHENTRAWVLTAQDEDIFIAFHYDDENESRLAKEKFLRSKLNFKSS